ncbi:UDP-glycosyltransferase 89B2 [Ziziphus jujuba]|uniref:UDP-glycosyltransferase 89B2 n=1 Tax=Ziziphus jujuba TaxID=326968 RepID=A0A6P3ZU79_ZIZJJ|nr:UDP-glycosyltransferase 89B2 [Ziziphus jujuba]
MSTSSDSSATFKETHILVYGQFSSSHFKPILDLTYRLLTRGLRVTVAVTTNNLHLLQPLVSTYPSSLQTFPLVYAENTDPSRDWLFANACTTYELHSPVLLQFFQTHPSPPVAIISDFFLGWTYELASKLGVPRLLFSPSPACALSVYYSLWRHLPKKEDANDAVSFPSVPNSPSFPFRQLPPYYLAYKDGDADSEFYRNCELGNMASWGVVFNSFAELEGVYIDRIEEEHGVGRVWAVGPLHQGTESVTTTSVESGGSKHGLLTWPDQRPNGSVIFVSFGSWVTLLDEQIKELALACQWGPRRTRGR